jgi:hypothetical protein
MSSSTIASDKVFIGPGLSLFKRVGTILGVVLILALVLWIAFYQGLLQGSSAIGSTVVAVLFILGFLYYLRLIAPVPFTIELGTETLVKKNQRGEFIEVHWENMTKIKEEFFPNGKRISISIFRKPAGPQEKAKAWAVYRDDVTDLDGLAEALQAAMPETCTWISETVHE